MQISVNVSAEDIISSIKAMDFTDLERIKSAIIEREIYFKRFQKDEIKNIMADFKAEGYSEGFLKDLEMGLKKSSPYHDNQTP
jgi:Cdc6-like AAA superfamily ATPase